MTNKHTPDGDVTHPPFPVQSLGMRIFSRLLLPHYKLDMQQLARSVRDKTIVITGASFGIGEATAYLLAQAGAVVVLTARHADKLEEVVTRITAQGGRAYYYCADLTNVEEMDAMARAILERHPRIDAIVSNAGKSIRRSLKLSYDRPQDIERTIATNYTGPARLLLHLLPGMHQCHNGHVVNVSSIIVQMGPAPFWAAYLASKGAFDLWLRSNAPELKEYGIGMTSIYMPLVDTKMSQPTHWRAPCLTPDEAGALICRALLDRPYCIAPWWLMPLAWVSIVFWRPVRWAMRYVFRHSADSEAAIAASAHHTDRDEHM